MLRTARCQVTVCLSAGLKSLEMLRGWPRPSVSVHMHRFASVHVWEPRGILQWDVVFNPGAKANWWSCRVPTLLSQAPTISFPQMVAITSWGACHCWPSLPLYPCVTDSCQISTFRLDLFSSCYHFSACTKTWMNLLVPFHENSRNHS